LKSLATLFLCLILNSLAFAKPAKKITGLYLQWGYNRDWYSMSDIHFKNGDKYDFTIHDAKAQDRPDFDAILHDPKNFTIPQYNYRIGFYLNDTHTEGIELNFDHTKYIVKDYQTLRTTGSINNEPVNADILYTPDHLHFEHSDGANFYHLNYFGQKNLWERKPFKLSWVYKLGAGIVFPRTDVTMDGKELNNRFHVAGFVLGAETGLRIYPLKRFFIEGTVKGGYADYLNALTIEGGKANHHFWYFETIAMVGYEFPLHQSKSARHPSINATTQPIN